MCREIKSNEKRHPRAMAQQIREISGKKRTARSTVIKDRHGNMLTDREDAMERWKEYVEEKYSDVRGYSPTTGKLILVRDL